MKILFVDDESSVLEGFERMFFDEAEDWIVMTAIAPQRALQMIAADPPDVIVSDMRMPGMDGAAFLNIVRERWPRIIRIVLTGETSREAALRSLPAAHQFLLKPCTAGELVELIRRTYEILELLNDVDLRALAGGVSSLPALPETYRKLQEVLNRPEPQTKDIVAAICSDAGVTAKLMQLANSAFFSRRTTTTDVGGAVMQLGISTVRGLVLQLGAYELGEKLAPPMRECMRELQAKGMKVGTIAAEFVKTQLERDQAFLAGLLCEVGQLVLAAGGHPEWKHILEDSSKQHVPLEVLEAERLHHTHGEVGAFLLGVWGLPYPVAEAAAAHHKIEFLAQSRFDIPAAVCVATALVEHREFDLSLIDQWGVRGRFDEIVELISRGVLLS